MPSNSENVIVELVRTLPYPPDYGAVKGARFAATIDGHGQALLKAPQNTKLVAPKGTFLVVPPTPPRVLDPSFGPCLPSGPATEPCPS